VDLVAGAGHRPPHRESSPSEIDITPAHGAVTSSAWPTHDGRTGATPRTGGAPGTLTRSGYASSIAR
jgi:hypothetical protein